MLARLWRLIRNPKNREVISWLGGGAIVVLGGIWTVFVFFHHDERKSADAPAPSVTQSGGGIASGHDTVVNGPVNIGLDEKKNARQIAQAQRPLEDKLEKLVIEVARQKGIELPPLRAILVKLGEADIRDEDIAKRLDDKADELIKLRDEIEQLRRGPAELATFAQQAQALIAAGDFDGARHALAGARAAASKLREQAARYEADFLAQEARIDHLQLAYPRAAAKYAEAASLVASIDRIKQWQFVLLQARELYSQGFEFGDNGALTQSLDLVSSASSLAPRSERPREWAETEDARGLVLKVLGERDAHTARLELAAAAFRDALTVRTREALPLDWVRTQINLAAALIRLGERDAGTSHFEEAVAAYRAALTVESRERDAFGWAAIQRGLGFALTRLAERGTGTAHFEEAVAAFQAALTVQARDSGPLNWAGTQNNLGLALVGLGRRNNDVGRLEEAVAAYRAVLTVHTRERVPLEWARVQSNIGVALANIGARGSGTAQLEEAVVAFQESLEERTRERSPVDWARTESALGATLALLGQREGGTVRITEAIAAYRAALTVRTRDDDPYGWQQTQGNLSNAEQLLAERQR